jgi:UDP-2,4-diacetamido-2,4,6-trideoxy-beta-L-altropyranose hydrolase
VRFVIRADASVLIGTGHVMRCLTLALALREKGHNVFFICRQHPGNIIHRLEANGFQVYELPCSLNDLAFLSGLSHAEWLGATQERDTELCIPIISQIKPDWLIVDHYAIDHVWHEKLRPFANRIMVIDDLADRRHDCDLLLDQNYGKQTYQYHGLVNNNTKLLIGTHFALLRPEFLQWRERSLRKRQHPEIKRLLITMGGIDADNLTCKTLTSLQQSSFSSQINIDVVMGSSAPWLEAVELQAKIMTTQVDVKVDVDNMAELMANADLAIGAAGSTSWERCCLGLPSITVVLADNQKVIAAALTDEGAALCIDSNEVESLNSYLDSITAEKLTRMSQSGSKIVDGLGVMRTVDYLTS